MIYGYIQPDLNISASAQKDAIAAFAKEQNLQLDGWLNALDFKNKYPRTTALGACLKRLQPQDMLVCYTYPLAGDSFSLLEETAVSYLKKGVSILSVKGVFCMQTHQKIKEFSRVGNLIGQIEERLLSCQQEK